MKTPEPPNVPLPETVPQPPAPAAAQAPEYPVTLNLPKSYTDKDVRDMLPDSWRAGSARGSLSLEMDAAVLSYPPIVLHVGGAFKSVRFSWLAAAAAKMRELGWPGSAKCHFCGARQTSLTEAVECVVETRADQRRPQAKAAPVAMRNVFVPCCPRCQKRFNQAVSCVRKWKAAHRRGMAAGLVLAAAVVSATTLGPWIFPVQSSRARLFWLLGMGLLAAAGLALLVAAFIKEGRIRKDLSHLGFEDARRDSGPLLLPLLEKHPAMKRFQPCAIHLELQLDALEES